MRRIRGFGKIVIRVFGQAELIRYRTFEKKDWDNMLHENGMEESHLLENIFDPDFFENATLLAASGKQYARSISGFFGANTLSGPLYNQMALIEMKFGRKKIFRGTLNAFIGEETIFPLVNTIQKPFEISSQGDKVTIFTMERTVGLVTHAFSSADIFDAQKFNMNVSEIKAGTFGTKIISGFMYNAAAFRHLKQDALIRSREAWLV